jgi:hypothetical protein
MEKAIIATSIVLMVFAVLAAGLLTWWLLIVNPYVADPAGAPCLTKPEIEARLFWVAFLI